MTGRARLGRVARRVALGMAVLALVASILALAVHLPWVQGQVAMWAFARLEAGGIRIQTRALRYNLATRRVHVEGLVVSTTADPQHPFLEADRLDVMLPGSVWTGRLGVTSIDGDGVRVVLLRRQDGSTNFPHDRSGGATSAPASFPIGAVTLPNVSLIWRDAVFGADVSAEALSIALRPAAGGPSGTVALARPATFRMGDRLTSFTARAQLTWDGAKLSWAALGLEAPEGALTASGNAALLGGDSRFNVDASGSADLDRVAAWFTAADRPAGRATFHARASGTVAEPVANVTVTSQSLSWQGLTDASFDAVMHLDRHALDAGRFSVRALGGTATGRGRVSFSEGPERARVALDWHDVDGVELLAAIGQTSPVRIETTLDGRATASWSAWRTDALTADVNATTRSAAPVSSGARALGLNGGATVGARAGRWHGTIDQWVDRAVHVTGRADGQLSSASFSAPTITAAVAAAGDSLPELWGTLHAVGLVGAAPPPTLTGSARADLALSGRVSNPVLAGRIEAKLPALDELRTIPRNLRPSGGLSVSGVISGTATAPAMAGRVSSGALSMAGQHVDRLDASWSLTPQALRVEPLLLTQAAGRLTVTGQYGLRRGDVDAHLSAGNFAMAPIPGAQSGDVLVPVSARLSGEWQATGALADPQGAGQLELLDTIAFDRDVGRVSTRLTLANRRLQAAIDLPDLFTTGTATLAMSSPGAFAIDARTTDADLARLMSRLRVSTSAPVTGVASFSARVEGATADITHARGTVDLQRFEGAVGEVPVRSTGPGRASYDGRTLDVAGVAFEIGRSQFRAAGRLGADMPGTLAASLDGDAQDVQQLALVFLPAASLPAGLQVDGRVHLDVRAPGSLERPALSAALSVAAGGIGLADQPPSTKLTVRASYDAGAVTLSRLEATWQGATVSATGDVPLALVAPGAPVWIAGVARPAPGPARVQARVESITPAVLASVVPAATLSQLTALVSGTVTLEADRPELAAVRGQLVLDHVDMTFAGVPFAQQRPTRVDVANGRAEIAVWDWAGAGNRFSVGGRVRFDGTPALDLTADGTVDLRALGAFFPEVATGGTAVLEARVTGAPGDPRFDGHVDVQRGELRMTSPRIAISDLAGRLVLSSDQVTVNNVTGHANGGSIAVTGAVRHARFRPTRGRLAITGRSLAMAIPEALKTAVDLDLALVVDAGALSLLGDAAVIGGSYREPISLATGLLDMLKSSPGVVQLDAPSALDAMALDIHLTTRDDIVVDNNYGQLAIAADVHLGGTVAQPSVVGRAEAREGGRIFLGGNVYRIVGPGIIDFSNPSRIEPDLRITAVTRVAGNEITMTLKGTPATLETTLTSDSLLSQGEIVSLLVTGQTQNASALAITSDQMLGYLSGEVLGVTGRALGLNTLRIERGQDVRFDAGLVASETDPASRLTFGKQVTRNVEVVFSQSLKDSGKLTWIVGYRPRPNIELRVVSQDNQDRIYDFRHDVTIGGGSVAIGAVRGAAPPVGSVSFTGTSGLPEAALRQSLRLTEGKTFDFFRWQQDRDRLEAALRTDNHFEARVAARRSDAQAAGAAVDLTYDVSRGPRTTVDISGIPRDGALQRELERLWEEAVFDGFLRDEASDAVRARMIRNGYLRADVITTIEAREGAGEKHLVVRIAPGPRSTSRRLVFTGQQHVSAERLDELAAQLAPSASPWVDSAPLVRVITTMYRNEGFLDTGVVVGPAAFDGDAATLPVVITEGPPFHLETVAFTGATSRPPAALAETFTLRPGAPLTRAAADAAVSALTTSYRADGFNTVRVTLTSQATRDSGLVALTVRIDEGPRQVVGDVVIEGVRRTKPTLVTRELHLEAGQPVNLAAWAEARKRLYDTGVFRAVDIQPVPMGEPTTSGQGAEQSIRARVTLDEWPPLRLRYGFELDDVVTPASETRTLRPGVAADATYRNVFGRAATTGLALRYTKDFEAARTFFTTPSFFGLRLVSNLFLARSREHLGVSTSLPYLTDKTEFTAEQRFGARRRLQIAYSYNFQRTHTFDANADPEDPFALDITVNVARLTATALVDTRDDLVDATRGRMLSSTFEYGPGGLGSELRFAKYFLQHNYYRALGHGVVFATAARLGLAAGYGQELILSERFYAGGGNSVRGFREDTLGPVDGLGDPDGGNALLVFNEEVRFPIVWRLRGVGFLDLGSAFATIGDVRLGGLRAGAGFGLRVQTPFALLRVDLGAPLARRPGESRARWFFSIGQSF